MNYRDYQKALKIARNNGLIEKSFKLNQKKEVLEARYKKMISDVPAPQEYDTDEVLDTIEILDQQFNTDNYLPIYHLREHFPIREALDKALYKLESQDLIELSTIVEAVHYTNEQLAAGIPTLVGGCQFFIQKYVANDYTLF